MTIFDTLIDEFDKLGYRVRYQLKRLKHGPRLAWHRLWVREDEFDKSLDMDGSAMMDMNKTDQAKYLHNLAKRRQIAHERDMDEDDEHLKRTILKDKIL